MYGVLLAGGVNGKDLENPQSNRVKSTLFYSIPDGRWTQYGDLNEDRAFARRLVYMEVTGNISCFYVQHALDTVFF